MQAKIRVWCAGFLATAAVAVVAAGCGKRPPPQPDAPSPRLVTFSPALTQIVYEMGLGDHVVGVTTQCEAPPGRRPTVVGDAFGVGAEAILAVKPHVVLVQMQLKEFQPLRLIDPNIRIEHFTIETIPDIPAAMKRIGLIVGRPDLAGRHIERFGSRLDAVRKRVAGKPRPRTLFVMGYQQPSTGGQGTFVADMIELAGGVNAAEKYRGWTSLNAEAVLACRPDVLVCQVLSELEKPEDARKYWSQILALQAKTVRLYVQTDRRWTIPSARTAEYVQKLADMLHPPDDGGPRH